MRWTPSGTLDREFILRSRSRRSSDAVIDSFTVSDSTPDRLGESSSTFTWVTIIGDRGDTRSWFRLQGFGEHIR